MTDIREHLLESKMTEIEQARIWSPRVISRFETLVRSGDDLSLYRINPLAFARDRAISEAESIDLFLHATRSGLFEMSWDVVCPQSGMVLDSFGALRTLKTHYVCGLCDVSGETDLDDFIEVTFTVSQQVRFLDFLQGLVRGLAFLPPGATTTLRSDLGPGALSGVNVQTQAAFAVPNLGEPAATPTHLRVRYDGQRFSPSVSAVPPGPIVIDVENSGTARGSLLLINWPPEVLAQTVKPTLDFEPYMSGGMLLARQTFRRLFRSERVDEREGLGIRQVTLLFTDLKGSTAMYERLGDLNAYALVREHFALLGATVQQHSGAIVKTIGDAVMAVFSRPTDAVSAALDMLGEIERYNSEHGDPSIILKIGAHCGPSIAVTLNENLDYFGQTVNVAARVQSLAEAGEICISEALYSAPGVSQILTGLKIVEFDAPLRGVEGNASVYRVLPG